MNCLLIRVLIITLMSVKSICSIGQAIANRPTPDQQRIINVVVNTINANDSNKVLQFITGSCTKNFMEMAPMIIHQEVFLNLFHQTGGLTVNRTSASIEDGKQILTATCLDRNFKLWHKITAYLNAEYKIDGLQISASTPELLNSATITEKRFTNEITAIINNACALDAFSGTVLISRGSSVILHQVCGKASKVFNVSNNIQTRFNLGSMNKMFTAVAIMQLIERGKIKITDKLSNFVDESWLSKRLSSKISVEQLLTHTSGLGDYFDDSFFNASRERFRTLEDYKVLISDDTLLFEPGKRFEYSNTGMLLLGVVIEKASGMGYFDYIRDFIYNPVKMTRSDSYDLDKPIDNLADGYIHKKNGYENNLFKHVIKGGPAGGGYSTANDLHKFGIALINGELVSKSLLGEMFADNSNYGYGYGFEIKKIDSNTIVGHSGAFPGISTSMDIFQNKGYIAIVLSNYDEAGHSVAKKIREMILQIKP